MAKYLVVKPWYGGNVKAGDVVELKTLHPALKANVVDISTQDDVELVPATPNAGTGEGDKPVDRKGTIAKRLKELGIEFNGRLGAEKLSELLPEGELEALFPDE